MDDVISRDAATMVASKSGEVLTIELSGEFDVVSLEALKGEIAGILEETATSATIDMTNLRFMDSSGIAVLLRFADRFGPLQIVNPSRIISQIIEVIGIADILKIARADAN